MNLAIDLVTLTLGIVTYAIVSKFLRFLTTVLSSGCINGFALTKLAIYEKEIQEIVDQNLYYVIIIGARIFVMIFNVIMAVKSEKKKVTNFVFLNILRKNILPGHDENCNDMDNEKEVA